MNKTGIFLLAFFIVLTTVFIIVTYDDTKKPDTLPVVGSNTGHKIKPFSFVNQEGATVTEKDIEGKVFVVEYFFTTCKGICPKMNENMSKVYEAFRGNESVKILSHTVDPIKDTIEAMKAYSLRFDADPKQWMFLTGDKKELYDIARYSYLISASDDTATVDIQSDFIHTDRFVLVDRDGYIRGKFYIGTDEGDVNQLIGDIKKLLKEKPLD
ncbi:MAG: SCO family protein [Chitinophagales bacterium]|nr:SCO family protein [Chitinophagaceae bacterium]MCB9065056.1 SCO family protein [Chitinophagales bacterium]